MDLSALPPWLQAIVAIPVLGTALQLVVVLVLFVLLRRALRLASRQLEARIDRSVPELDRRGRLRTLLKTGYGVALAVLILITVSMTLHLLGINIGPLIASAGVAGLAISLGAQTLIKDYIGGVLILAEDQFRVGDVVEINGVGGEVVRVTLRVTHLRNVEGKLISVPNGDVRTVANLTREWARAVVDVHVPPGTDIDRVSAALERATEAMQAIPEIREALIEPPQIISWNSLLEWAIQVRLMAKTRPGQQWAVGRALRQHAVEALQAEGVRLARPVTVLQQGEMQ